MLRRAVQTPFTPVGGRAAHDHTLVAAGEWTEFPLYGNGQKYELNCARCPVTSGLMEQVEAAMGLASAGGGETLFSTLKVRHRKRGVRSAACEARRGSRRRQRARQRGVLSSRGPRRCRGSVRNWPPARAVRVLPCLAEHCERACGGTLPLLHMHTHMRPCTPLIAVLLWW